MCLKNIFQKKDDRNLASTSQNLAKSWRLVDYHSHEKIIGSLVDKIENRRYFRCESNMSMISHYEPKSIDDAIIDESRIKIIKEEWLSKFDKNQVWNLVSNRHS